MPAPRENPTPAPIRRAAQAVVEGALPVVRKAIRDAASALEADALTGLQAVATERARSSAASSRPPADPTVTPGVVQAAITIEVGKQLTDAVNRQLLRDFLDAAVAADKPRPATATQTVTAYVAGLAGRGSIDRLLRG